MDDEPKVEQLENRIDSLESTIEKMMPSRRDALKMGGAALIGGAAMSGTASAGSNQVGTIGDKDATPAQLVDLHSEDINNADTVTTQDLVVNGTATGPFGGGAPVLEAGDSITVNTVRDDTTSESFIPLYDSTAKDVVGGVVYGAVDIDFLYTFDDNSTIRQNGTGTTYSRPLARGRDAGGNLQEVSFLPPARNVRKIEIGANIFGGSSIGAKVILKD